MALKQHKPSVGIQVGVAPAPPAAVPPAPMPTSVVPAPKPLQTSVVPPPAPPSNAAPAAPTPEFRSTPPVAVAPTPSNPLDAAIKAIIENPAFVTEAHITLLVNALPTWLVRFDETGESMGDFDMRDEVAQQLKVVRGLRASIFDGQGRLLSGKDPRDAREVVTAAANLFSLLMKFEEKIDRNSRLQAIEQIIYETFDDVADPALKKRFLELLNAKLETLN